MSKILVVDDESSVRASLAELLVEEGYKVIEADGGGAAMQLLERERPDLLISDIQMPDMNGLEAFHTIKKAYPKLPVIIMTAYGTTETAIEAMMLGAFDYHLKPFDPARMLETVEHALECVRLMKRRVTIDAAADPSHEDAIIGQSDPMQEVYKAIGRVAPTEASVLIRGETGTGKELVARAIYHHSLRKDKPLLMVNCVAIPDTLLESELFGHEKGAFTGAHSRRIGKFEQANGGTIFLDEIGDIPLMTQAKLLRVLQERRFERVGGNETVRVDVRVLAATNRDLEAAIHSGKFREDLYHRIDVVTITIPPLRERDGDLGKLARYFIKHFARELKIDEPVLSEGALQALQTYPWPGNVRELEHCIQRALIFTHGYPVQKDDVEHALQRSGHEEAHAISSQTCPIRVGMTLDQVESEFLKLTLAATNGNKKEAARMLGISRRAIYDKLKKFSLI